MQEDDSYPKYRDKDPGAPFWLNLSYLWVPLLGFLLFYLYWNGSAGWVDRGHWQQLERAANTTYPFVNQNEPPSTENGS